MQLSESLETLCVLQNDKEGLYNLLLQNTRGLMLTSLNKHLKHNLAGNKSHCTHVYTEQAFQKNLRCFTDNIQNQISDEFTALQTGN